MNADPHKRCLKSRRLFFSNASSAISFSLFCFWENFIAAKKTLELLIDLKFFCRPFQRREISFASDWYQKKKSTVLKYHVYSGGTMVFSTASAWHLFNLSTFFEMIYQPDSFFSRLIHTAHLLCTIYLAVASLDFRGHL